MRFLSAGDQALLVELPDLAHTMALYRACVAQPVAGVAAMVPAAQTLLVQFQPWAITHIHLQQALQQRAQQAWQAMAQAQVAPSRLVRIPVHYCGEDLAEVAHLLGLSVQEVVHQHTAQPYDAAFAGFAPGFVYLSGGANFHVPRRSAPRTKVPAGAVALGGNFSAVYPSASPGGWQLLGVTDVPMWDLSRAEPAYIQPGFQVQFVDAARMPVQVAMPAAGPAVQVLAADVEPLADGSVDGDGGGAVVTCISTGLHTAFQDHGRHGMEGLGISASGALDQGAMRRANRMVGNPIYTPVLENLLGQLVLRADAACTLAVAGAAVKLQVRSAQGAAWLVSQAQPVALNAGDSLHIGTPMAGVRCYVAVRGGWGVSPVLGSCATDSLAQVGPAPLRAGQMLHVGQQVPLAQLQAAQVQADDAAPLLPRAGDTVTLQVVLGPRNDWFTAQALKTLTEQSWEVTPQSNRIGMRLQGAQPLVRSQTDELPSEGTVLGALQVPISGQPVLFLADHPLTGGYPVIAALASHHLDLAAQIPVGCRIRFEVVPQTNVVVENNKEC